MQNVKLDRQGDKLIIEIDLSQDLGPSSTGKTNVIGTTRGNVSVTDDGTVRLSVNCYKYTKPKGA